MDAKIPSSFFSKVESLPGNDEKVRWYYCVMVNLAALNYPTLVPSVYEHMSAHVMCKLSHEEQFAAARKLREAFIKACGIMGAAKTGTALRLLCKQFPPELRDDAAPRYVGHLLSIENC